MSNALAEGRSKSAKLAKYAHCDNWLDCIKIKMMIHVSIKCVKLTL